jgi:predicted NAD/FAD-dependent oxidoreductase
VSRVAVVGAGLAGLAAGEALRAAGHEVVLFDKGRSPGGRMATRRIGGAVVDHGAQFFTVRTPELAERVERWIAEGLVFEWSRGFGPEADGYPRYAVRGGMNALAKRLAEGLDVRCSSLVFELRVGSERAWTVLLDDGSLHHVDAVISTAPLPQSYSIAITTGVELPRELITIDYERTLALLAVLDGPPAIPAPGAVQHGDPTFSMIVDNVAKGVSTVPAVTMHANAAWSLEWWERPHDETLDALEAAAAPWLGGAAIVERQLKRWRFATPVRTWPDPCWVAPGVPPLIVAGDAFAGPRVEGALRSGWAAATAVSAALA